MVRFSISFLLLFILVPDVFTQTSVSAENFYFLINEKPHHYLVDVRDSASFTHPFFLNADWFPSKVSLVAFADTADHDVPVFIYCTEGKRSAAAMKILTDLGFKQIYNLKKGIAQWPTDWNDSEQLMNKIPD